MGLSRAQAHLLHNDKKWVIKNNDCVNFSITTLGNPNLHDADFYLGIDVLASAFGQWLTKICQPYMSWFRFIPPILGIDFSPILALLVLELCSNGLTYIEALLFGVTVYG